MGRVTILSADDPPRVLESYVAPGDDTAVYAAAARWAKYYERQGVERRFRIEAPGQPTLEFDAAETKSLAMLHT